MKYYILQKGEIIQPGDECEMSAKWNAPAKWVLADEHDIGKPAPDPNFLAHRKYRRLVTETTPTSPAPAWFIKIREGIRPANKLQKEIHEELQALNHTLTDSPDDIEKVIVKIVQDKNEKYPKTRQLYVSFYTNSSLGACSYSVCGQACGQFRTVSLTPIKGHITFP